MSLMPTFGPKIVISLRVSPSVTLDDLPDRVTETSSWKLIGRVEHQQLDFKLRADGLDEVFAAMSMTDGGLVVLGIRDNRTVEGCPMTQAVLDRVSESAHAYGLDVQARETSVDGTALTVVGVPEVRGRIVTTPSGRLMRRVGSHNRPLVGDSLARFVREREERSAEEEVVPNPHLDDFDLELVNRALAGAGHRRVRRDGLLRAFVDLGVARVEGAPTGIAVLKAAVLLFARDPRRYIPGAAVQAVQRAGVGPGPGPTTSRVELVGPIPALLDEVQAFLDTATGGLEVVVGPRRERLPAYPIAALREAVLNALAHRDYGLIGATVDVTVWDDRVEVQSPGPLPGHITLENIRDEHYSRNRRVMQVLKLLRLVEEYGEGVDRMFQEMEDRLLEPPLFVTTQSSVTVTLRNRSPITADEQAWLAVLGRLDLKPAERRALVLARREGAVTPRLLRVVLADHGADVDGVLRNAVAKGLLTRVGQRGGARYVLSDEVTLRAGTEGVEARTRKRQQLLDELRRRGPISTAEAARAIGEVDVSLVRELLNDLVRAGLAMAEGRTRGRRYRLA
jgi:ATP-dependent DNA helicase RecG